MATQYLDPEAGNDANNGLSFANRRKTWAGLGALAAGDDVRVIASYDPVTSVDATWTNASNSLTLSAALTGTITGSTAAWTAAPNVTCTAPAGSKIGANYASMSIAAGFTTGQAAYFDLGSTQDFSAYTAVSLCIVLPLVGGFNLGTVASINLCSDAVGAVVVDTIPLRLVGQGANFAVTANTWYYILYEKGSALSTTVRSVSLNFASDPGTCIIGINNIEACQARGNAGHLSHGALVGKMTSGEPEWYPVRGILGTTVLLGSVQTVSVSSIRTWRGVSETVPFYVLAPIGVGMGVTAERALNSAAGTDAAPVVVSGGWDRTAMTTQSGETHMGWCYPGLVTFNAAGVLEMSNIGASNVQANPINLTASAGSTKLNLLDLCGNQASVAFGGTLTNRGQDVTVRNVVNNQTSLFNFGGTSYMHRFKARRITGTNLLTSGNGDGILTIVSYANDPSRTYGTIEVESTDNNTRFGISTGLSRLTIIGWTNFANNGTAIIALQNTGVSVDLIRCAALSFGVFAQGAGRISQTAIGNDRLVNTLEAPGFDAVSQSAVVRSSSPSAWAIVPSATTTLSKLAPAALSLARIAVAAGSLVTVKCWTRRNNAGLNIGIKVVRGWVPGVDDQEVYMTAAINTWEELTLTFTPTSEGVVELWGVAYGGTTFTGYFDDITVTQV